jgi:hypothetical protein
MFQKHFFAHFYNIYSTNLVFNFEIWSYLNYVAGRRRKSPRKSSTMSVFWVSLHIFRLLRCISDIQVCAWSFLLWYITQKTVYYMRKTKVKAQIILLCFSCSLPVRLSHWSVSMGLTLVFFQLVSILKEYWKYSIFFSMLNLNLLYFRNSTTSRRKPRARVCSWK